ncbi:MAG: cell division protein ZapA [Myxococcales bacterium]|nr:cell division protein ZapA [Myxococcales bacterium]MCB9752464.1 cell division protein ZapA [Myxococcales bacterium]
MKRTVQVEIAGQRLTIRSDEGPDYVHELATYVDAHLQQLSGGRRTTSPQRVALLVAMQIADELFRERDLHAQLRARVSRKLAALGEAMDAHERRLAQLGDEPLEHASAPE